MIKELANEYNTFIFDLDRTVWDTHCKYGNLIWAKQVLEPFESGTTNVKVVDDCFSVCELQRGCEEVLRYLHENNKNIGFLSRGGIPGVPHNLQPSVKLLKHFKIYDFFNYAKVLVYKTDDKGTFLQQIVDEQGSCVFFDDSQRDLAAAANVSGILPIDRNSFESWESLL
jgi:predicted phosphatase